MAYRQSSIHIKSSSNFFPLCLPSVSPQKLLLSSIEITQNPSLWALLEKNCLFSHLSIQILAQWESDPRTAFWSGVCSECWNTLILFISHKEETPWDTSVGVIYLESSQTGILKEHVLKEIYAMARRGRTLYSSRLSGEQRTNALFGAPMYLAAETTETGS